MFGLPPNVVLIALMVSIGTMAIMVGIFLPKLSAEKTAKTRVEGVSRKTRNPKARAQVDEAAKRKKSVQESLKEIEDRNSGRKRRQHSLNGQLAQAGLSISKSTFLLWSGVASVIFGLGGLISGAPPIVAAGLAFFGFLGMPRMFLGYMKKRRLKRFVNELPDAVDLIVRGVKAGLPLNDCLRQIAYEAREPVASEFKVVIETQQLGIPASEAIQKLYERIPTPEANFLATVISIQQSSGGSLSEALSNLSTVLRARKKMRAKVNAISSEAKSSAAIIGALPILVGVAVSVLNPKFMEPLFTTTTGNFIIAGGLGLMLVGVLVMRKMINFEI